MIKNYFTIAWRNLVKHKSFSFINILGLAIGIAACMIIFLYVRNEMTYDLYNKNVDRIVRITGTYHTPESDLVLATTPVQLADILRKDYPEVESVVRIEPSPQIIKFNNDVFREDAFYKADQTIFSIFDFEFIEGTEKDALKNPNAAVITATIAKKYFGKTSAIGKTIICNDQPLLITGVIKDRPVNSDIHIDALLSADLSKNATWLDDFDVYSYILFKTKPDLKNFRQKVAAISKKYLQPELDAQGAKNYSVEFMLEPLKDVHFSRGKFIDTPKGNKQFNYIFSLLAIFILFIALLNYINLSTAKATERAKEVGIRKVSGAIPFQLLRQFLFESFFLVAISWICAIALVIAGLPFFNKLLQTKLSIDWQDNFLFMSVMFIITFLLAGLYPAFVLSRFKPVKVLKGNWRHSTKGIFLRKSITVTQFAIAAALILGTTVIYNQMKYIQQKDLGFNKDQLLNIYLPRDSALLSSVHAFQDALRQRPEVHGVTIGNGMTAEGMTLSSTVVESFGKKRELMCNYYAIDPYFLPVFGIQLMEGRNLSDDFGTDKNEGFIVNEAFVKMMGWKSGIGHLIEGWGHKGKIVGVTKNFYYRSMHNLVEPLVMVYNTFPANTTSIRINPKDLAIVKTTFKQYFPSTPPDYSFFDEIIEKQYEKDNITMSLFKDFTLLAILVSCLGLYGLAALIAVQRTKEIGIRKVLGASLKQLLTLMTKDFLKLVIVALFIALPIAGFVMNKWLSGYAYHVRLNGWMFIIPALVVIAVALAVISKEIIKTALINPVKSLRTE